ncbi:MAG TPA: ATP-binding protein, partial [Anaeromyxobacter sp.]
AAVQMEGGTGLLLTEREVTAGGADPRRLGEEAWLATFPERNPNPILEADLAGHVAYVNPAAARLFPDLREREAGHPWLTGWEEVVRATRERAGDWYSRVVRVGERHYQQTMYFVPEGERVRVYGADVTDRRRAEDVLRDSEERFRSLADSAPVIMWMTDAEGGVVFANRACLHFFGVALEQLSGGAWRPLVHPGDAAYVESFLRAVRERAPFRAEGRLRRFDGEWRWVESYGAPRFSASGRFLGHVGLSPEVHDRKEMEHALREADRRKDEFLGMLSHELRNPLAPIRNAVYLLERGDPAGPQAERARAVIRRQTEHLTRLVDDLLDVTRIARGKIEPRREQVDLRELVRSAADDFRPVMEARGIAFRTDVAGAGPWADADATRLAQLVGNLLHNAAKFTGRGGEVVLSLRATQDEAEIAVRDTGEGIEPGLLPRVFDAFVQGERALARSEGGLGLGLALVKGIAELHGWTVRAESAGAGKGAAFVVRLPLAAAPDARQGAVGPSGRRANVGRRVLVVDDNADSAETLAEIVEMLGHAAEIAYDGPSALAKARANPPDVVLCDIGLPGMNGYDVAKALRAEGARMQLVALSGYAQPDDLKAAAEAGFDAHVAKPADLAQIEQLLA